MFGSQCNSIGNYSQNAINVGNTMIATFRKLLEDPKCSNSQGLIDSLYNFQTQLRSSYASFKESQVIELERRIEDLTMALNSVTDPVLLSQIISQLSSARLQLISAKSSYEADETIYNRSRKLDGYYVAASSLKQMFQKLPDIQFCSDNYLNFSNQIISNGLNVASYFVNPGLSSAMSGLAVLTNTAIDAIVEVARNRRLAKLNEIMLPTALSCSVEVLTNMYCETIRAEKIIKKYSDYEENNMELWRGIPFIFRKLPPLLEWMEYLRAGAPASDSYDSQRRIDVLRNEAYLKELKQRVDGFISNTDIEIPTVGENLDSYIMNKANEVVTLLRSSQAILTINGNDFLPFRLLGFSEIPSCDFQGRISPCSSLIVFKTYYSNGTGKLGYTFALSDWSNIKRIYLDVYREAVNFVNGQLARVVNEDQEIVLTRAFEGYRGKESPYKIIQDLISYLNGAKQYLSKNNTDDNYSPQILNIESTQVILTEVLDLLDKWKKSGRVLIPGGTLTPNGLNQEAGELLNKIYEKLKLDTGDRFFLERVKGAIRWDIIARVNNGDFDKELIQIIQLNNNNVISDITAYKLFDLQEMINDIANAKGILKGTLDTFFGETEKFYLRSLDLIDERNLDHTLKEKICIHLLSSNFFTKKKIGEKFLAHCIGKRFDSIFTNANLFIRFDDYIKSNGDYNSSFDDRVCLFNKFMREVSIREQFKNNLPNN